MSSTKVPLKEPPLALTITPMTTLVQTFSGLVHKHDCFAVPKDKTRNMAGEWRMKFKVLGTVDDAEGFIRARGVTPCGSCWPGLREKIEAEKMGQS